MRKPRYLDDERIKKAEEILHPYGLKINTQSLFKNYKFKFSTDFYKTTIRFDKNFILIDYFTLDQLINISKLLKKEFELVNTKNYLLMRNTFYKKSNKKIILDTKNLINLHLPINNFDIKSYNSSIISNSNIINIINELCFYFRYEFGSNKFIEGTTPASKLGRYIYFILSDSHSEIFSDIGHMDKIRLLVYYGEIFNFKNKIVDAIEKKVLKSW